MILPLHRKSKQLGECYLHLILTTQEEPINSKMEAWQISANVMILS